MVDALSGDAPLGATGTITTQLTKVSQALAATEKFTGTIATHLTKASQAMAGSITPRITGTVTTVLHGISQQAHSPGTVTGAIVTQLTKANLALSATEVLTGAIVTHLDANAAFQLHATTYEAFVGHIVTNLSPMKFAQSLTGEERIVGHATTKLGSASGQIVANIVEATDPGSTGLATATANAITSDVNAAATGTAGYFRAYDSAGVCIVQGTVGTSLADMILNTVSIAAGATVAITSWSVTLPDGSAAD